MFATIEQIAYLQELTDTADIVKTRHPSLIPQGLYRTKWEFGISKKEAGLRIQMYRRILESCPPCTLPRRSRKVADTDDLPM